MRIPVLLAVLALGGCQTMKPHEVGRWLNPAPLALPADHDTLFKDEEGNRSLAYYLMNQSDITCENYLVGVSAGRNTSDAALGIGAQALSAVGGLVAGADAANAWSGASTFVQGANRTLNDTVFAGQSFQIIYDAVHRGREAHARTMRAEIDGHLWDELPHHGILQRVGVYDMKCGVNYGMVELSLALQRSAEADPAAQAEAARAAASEAAAARQSAEQARAAATAAAAAASRPAGGG